LQKVIVRKEEVLDLRIEDVTPTAVWVSGVDREGPGIVHAQKVCGWTARDRDGEGAVVLHSTDEAARLTE
jgi:hypothetical protein